mmetsp:Transcript_24072/g.48725  ORF Transcript_24072/g.48725 Transcript_24072/m.48725 type:complete len:341 (-) Transcript_24072:35-1057(-)
MDEASISLAIRLSDEEIAEFIADQESLYAAQVLQAAEEERFKRGFEQADERLAIKIAKEQVRTLRLSQLASSYCMKEDVRKNLNPCQLAAIEYVESAAHALHFKALPALRERSLRLGFSDHNLSACLSYIRDDAPIAIHLKLETLRCLVKDPWYRSQFETGTSGGTLCREVRQQWEDSMFGGAYARCRDSDHPKYGALNLTGDIMGVRPARCYGDFFILLAPHVRYRTSFSSGDSGDQTGHCKLATNEYYAHVLEEYTGCELRAVLQVGCQSRLAGVSPTSFSYYKECQIHGPISIASDVIALSVPGKEISSSSELCQLVAFFQVISQCNIMWQGDLLSG